MSTVLSIPPGLTTPASPAWLAGRERLLDDLRAMSVEEVIDRLLGGAALVVNTIYEMSACVFVLEEKGVPRHELRRRLKLYPHLDRINRGQLLAELLVKVDADRERLASLGSLPLPLQHRVVEGERIPVVVPAPDGTLTHVMADPFDPDTTPDMLDRAIDAERGCLRPEDAQAMLIHRERLEAAKPFPQKVAAAEVDAERVGGVIKGVFMSLEDLERLVAVLREIRRRKR